MLIQCQSCTHRFRLNLERLPARKTFVRCKNCGTPIYIHGEEEGHAPASALPESITVPEHLADSPVIPPWLAGMPAPEADDSVLVTCPQCESRYRMPREPLQRPEIKLKCTHCEHVFAPPAELLAARPPPMPMSAQEFHGRGDESAAVIPADQIVAEPDDTRMSGLFDDMAPDSGIRRPPPQSSPAPRAPDAEEAYLDAVDLGEGVTPGGKAAVPDDQRYRLFLKAGELPQRPAEPPPEPPVEAQPPEPAPASPEPAAEFDQELPPLDAEPPPRIPPAPPAPAQAAPAEPAIPPLGEEVPPLPVLVVEPPHKPPDKQRVPDQDRWLNPRQRYLVLGSVAAAVLLAAGLWAAWLWVTPSASQPYTIETGRVHQLALEENLEGRYVLNKPSGKRLFVVQGFVENHFQSSTEISWIRLRGTAYTDRNQTQTLGTTFTFVGNVLTDKQLGSWELEAILAYGGYNNGRDNANYRIPDGARIPFQLVFPEITTPVGRTVAQVVSYHRNNQAVYVDPGR